MMRAETKRLQRQEYYKKNREVYRSRRKKRQRARKEFVDSFKRGQTCSWCMQKPEVEKLVYHHIKPRNDDMKINHLVKRRRSEVRIITEIAKCLLVCASCHSKFHKKHEWDGFEFVVRDSVTEREAVVDAIDDLSRDAVFMVLGVESCPDLSC